LDTAGTGKRAALRLLAAGAFLLLLIVAARALPIGDALQALLEELRGLGALGYVLFVLAYVLAALLFLPGSLLGLGAGAAFGLLGGVVAVSIGSTLGAAVAFATARYVARQTVERWVAGQAKFEAIDRAVEREGFKIVALMRLSPVFPYNLLNYVLGLTRVRFWSFLLASWLGMLPGTIFFVYIGYAAGGLAKAGTPGWSGAGLAFRIAGLVATLLVTVVITRLARRALAEATADKPARESLP
jgi:uncharacterized membrane protein YdjX (TVP38/TMEM64 family)